MESQGQRSQDNLTGKEGALPAETNFQRLLRQARERQKAEQLPPKGPENVLAKYLQVAAQSIASEDHPDQNQDSFFALSNKKAFGVFDGMGGHAAGDKASRLAKETVEGDLRNLPNGLTLEQAQEAVKKALLDANAGIFDQRQKDRNNMGTTGSVVYMWEGKTGERKAVIGNVGDSRAYLFRRGRLEQVTLDDSLYLHSNFPNDEAGARRVQSKLNNATDSAQLSEAERRIFDNRNYILQALGSEKSVSPRLHVVDFMSGDRILVCSDGVSDNLTDNQMQEILSQSSSSDLASKNLVKGALEASRNDWSNIRSKPDDMTAIVINFPPQPAKPAEENAFADALARYVTASPEDRPKAGQRAIDVVIEQAVGGKEAKAIFDQLKQACETGDKAEFDRIRGSKDPRVRQAAEYSGKVFLIEHAEKARDTFKAFNKPYAQADITADVQRILGQK